MNTMRSASMHLITLKNLRKELSTVTFKELHKRLGTARHSNREIEIRNQVALVKRLEEKAAEERARLTLMLAAA